MSLDPAALIVAAHLILLHAADGREVSINPEQITSMYHTTTQPNVQVSKAARCVVNLGDGKFVGVQETCDAIKRAIEEMGR